MSILEEKIRSWWIEKPISNNIATGAVFERYRPTIVSAPGREWIRVISLDDFHKEVNMNITRWVEVCQQLAQLKQRLEEAEKLLRDVHYETDYYHSGIAEYLAKYKEKENDIHAQRIR